MQNKACLVSWYAEIQQFPGMKCRLGDEKPHGRGFFHPVGPFWLKPIRLASKAFFRVYGLQYYRSIPAMQSILAYVSSSVLKGSKDAPKL